MVTEKSASCYSQEQSSTKTIEKDFRIILGATVVGSPKTLTFKDETTFKAQHRRDEASGGVSGPVGGLHGPTTVLTTSGCMLTLWQNDTQRQKRTEPKCSVIVIMQVQSKNIYFKKKGQGIIQYMTNTVQMEDSMCTSSTRGNNSSGVVPEASSGTSVLQM